MEGSVRDRFRLIYLKSMESEKSTSKEAVLSRDSNESGRTVHSPYQKRASESFTDRAHLDQAESDLKHPDPKIRILAIRFLEKMDPPLVTSLLQEALSDRDPDVRAQAILALIKFRSPDIKPSLKRYLKDSSPKVKMAALRGIFQFEEGIDLNILLQLLSDESPWVRRKMATLLGWSRTEGVLPILAELSRDPDAKVRKAALFSLVSLYPEESEDRLLKAMTDP